MAWWPFPRMSWWAFIYSGGFALVIGIGNIFFAQRNRSNYKLRMAQEEIEHLAKVAERERIARDLHDVLGHTLSVIILKSELAGKLMDKDPERAKSEIRDVEQTSRQALAEVRQTIRGYRVQSLCEEIEAGPGHFRNRWGERQSGNGAGESHSCTGKHCRPDR